MQGKLVEGDWVLDTRQDSMWLNQSGTFYWNNLKIYFLTINCWVEFSIRTSWRKILCWTKMTANFLVEFSVGRSLIDILCWNKLKINLWVKVLVKTIWKGIYWWTKLTENCWVGLSSWKDLFFWTRLIINWWVDFSVAKIRNFYNNLLNGILCWNKLARDFLMMQKLEGGEWGPM